MSEKIQNLREALFADLLIALNVQNVTLHHSVEIMQEMTDPRTLAIAEFETAVLKVIGQVEPSARDAIIRELNKKRLAH